MRAALNASRSLIVVCSPAAAASPWVGREIELFRSLHPDRPILTAIRDGEPGDCFPEALRRTGPHGEPIEPLAADFRIGRDGEHLGLLKLVAGVIGIGLDELIRRDAQRNLRRVTAITAASLVAVLLMAALTVFALSARSEAERQRKEAEGLVEYMLTDLRDKLKGVGRLDVMTAVNERALRYYQDQDLQKLSGESLERRARTLHAMGEDDESRGNYPAALTKFREATRVTATLLAEAPNDPERLFNQAQSEFWIGYADYNTGHFSNAKKSLSTYKRLADRLIAIAPHNTKYRKEAGYAESNLCALALEKPVDRQGAMRHCLAALAQTREAAIHPDSTHRNPTDKKKFDDDLMNCLGNLADAYSANDNLEGARAQRLKEEKILLFEMSINKNDLDLKDTWVALQRAIAKLEIRTGKGVQAKERLILALKVAQDMINHDTSNYEWAKTKKRIKNDLLNINLYNRKGG